MTTALLPLAYGYVRDDLLEECDCESSEDMLRDTARSLGYELGTVFHEPAPQNATLPPAFLELVQECRRASAHAVITVCGHMSHMAGCRMVLLTILDARVGATVHEVSI